MRGIRRGVAVPSPGHDVVSCSSTSKSAREMPDTEGPPDTGVAAVPGVQYTPQVGRETRVRQDHQRGGGTECQQTTQTAGYQEVEGLQGVPHDPQTVGNTGRQQANQAARQEELGCLQGVPQHPQAAGAMLKASYRLLIVVLLVGVSSFAAGGNDSQRIKIRGVKWWTLANSGHETHNLVDYPSGYLMNPSLQPLTKRQRKLVTKNPGTILAIAHGARRAMEECQFQFRNRRWECPTSDNTNGGSIFGKILHKGCRETAFVYAITSASVSHSVARACSEGTVYTCTCGQQLTRKHKAQQEWRWGGCSDNIKYGHKFARKFVDVVERGQDLRYLMNLHNNEAGRQHVKKEMRQECKCHGMSGSCAIKTCWMRLPLFRRVGQLLKDRFDGASKVYQGNDVRTRPANNRKKRGRRLNLLPVNPNHKPPGGRDLVYYEKSPDFCEPNPYYGIGGTKGRQCDDDSMGVDGCDLMCCGRGHQTETYVARERCNCTFFWCCEVQCKVCTKTKLRHRCN